VSVSFSLSFFGIGKQRFYCAVQLTPFCLRILVLFRGELRKYIPVFSRYLAGALILAGGFVEATETIPGNKAPELLNGRQNLIMVDVGNLSRGEAGVMFEVQQDASKGLSEPCCGISSSVLTRTDISDISDKNRSKAKGNSGEVMFCQVGDKQVSVNHFVLIGVLIGVFGFLIGYMGAMFVRYLL
jgi:hypothetical protein